MKKAWYGVQIFEQPLGQRRSFRGEQQETEPEAYARALDTAKRFEAAATLWRWDGSKWIHLPWSWVNIALYRELLAKAQGSASKTWGRA